MGIMRQKSRRIAEAYDHSFMTFRGKDCQVYRNPTRKEWRLVKGKDDSLRAFLVGNDILIWNTFGAIHQMVRDELKLPPDAIPLVIYGNMGSECAVTVTDNTKNTPWWHNPDVADHIENHPFMRRAFSNIEEISYYDEAVYGDWRDLTESVLREGPESDVAALDAAAEAKQAFRNFLYANEDAEVVRLPHVFCWPCRNRDSIWAVPATEMGLPYDDLHIGVLVSNNPNERGMLVKFQYGGKSHYVLGLASTSDESPYTLKDVAWRLQWKSFSHEFQHYLDYKRRKSVKKSKMAKDYLNTPIEFNGHFVQAIDEILDELAHIGVNPEHADGRYKYLVESLSSFKSFEQYVRISGKDWVEGLNQHYRRKYLKRLYILYAEIRRTYPNVTLLRHRVERTLEIIRRNEEMYGAEEEVPA